MIRSKSNMRFTNSILVTMAALYLPSFHGGGAVVVVAAAAATNEAVGQDNNVDVVVVVEDFIVTDVEETETTDTTTDGIVSTRLLKNGKSNKNDKSNKNKKKKKRAKKQKSSKTNSPTATSSPTDTPPPLSDGELTFPKQVFAGNGRMVVTMDYVEHKTVAATTFSTRALHGGIPGNTVIVKSGETLEVSFQNNLVLQPNSVQEAEKNNSYGIPDTTNLHFHGGHISGEEPSDDIYIHVRPGDKYEYTSKFPENHMPGTHWSHPHVHGSSTLQVGGGAAFAIIVPDDPNVIEIPQEVTDATDILLVVQDFRNLTNSVASTSRDEKFELVINPDINGGDQFRLVNGKYRPNLTIVPGEWYRFRTIYAGWLKDNLDLQIVSADDDDDNDNTVRPCETILLAKDGIYIKDYPRPIDIFPLPAGGRADIMVRCPTEGSFIAKHYTAEEDLFTITSKLPKRQKKIKMSPGPTIGFVWDFPAYLTDLQVETTEPGCDCTTKLSRREDLAFVVNDRQFAADSYLHTVSYGDVAERTLTGLAKHTYHQHVYPFQVQTGFDNATTNEGGYWKNGDWQDSIKADLQNTITMKYRPIVFSGKIMLHCHILTHEDTGMMSQERVVFNNDTSGNGECTCDYTYDYIDI